MSGEHPTAGPPRRVLVTGAAGTGTTTLAASLAASASVPYADADDYFWVPTDPPYRRKRDPDERVALMQQLFLPRPAWVLSGSVMGWGSAGEEVMRHVDAAVLLVLDPTVRLERIVARQLARYGEEAIAPGGALHRDHVDFLEWCAGYDDPSFEGRNTAQHREWLASLEQPCVELDADGTRGDVLASCQSALAHMRRS